MKNLIYLFVWVLCTTTMTHASTQQEKIANILWLDVASYTNLWWKYHKDNQGIYSEWSYEYVNLADQSTFRSLWVSWYASDKNHIFYQWNIVTEIDIWTFTIDKNHDVFAYDSNNYYLWDKKIIEARKVLKTLSDWCLITKKSQLKCFDLVFPFKEISTYNIGLIKWDLKELKWGVYTDDSNIYNLWWAWINNNEVLVSKSRSDFSILNERYAKDLENVWFLEWFESKNFIKIENAELESFSAYNVWDEYRYAKDNNHIYFNWTILEDFNPNNFDIDDYLSKYSLKAEIEELRKDLLIWKILEYLFFWFIAVLVILSTCYFLKIKKIKNI